MCVPNVHCVFCKGRETAQTQSDELRKDSIWGDQQIADALSMLHC